MSKKKILKEAIRGHQPGGGWYGIELSCTCGEKFSSAHQIQAVLDGWTAESEYESGAAERYWAS